MGEEATVLWADNIQFLAKKKGLKLADISKELDIPTSFYSRARKGDTAANAYTLDKIAGFLGVTVDALLHYDFAGMTPNEILIVEFLQQVIRKTNEGEICWTKEKHLDFDGKWKDGVYYNVEHPLFELEPGPTLEFAAAMMTAPKDRRYVYCSRFHLKGAAIRVVGDCFNAMLDRTSKLFLMHVQPLGQNKEIDYELYIKTKEGINPVCCTSADDDSPINDCLFKLKMAANESSAHLRLNSDVKNYLEAFVGGKDPKEKKDSHTVVAN